MWYDTADYGRRFLRDTYLSFNRNAFSPASSISICIFHLKSFCNHPLSLRAPTLLRTHSSPSVSSRRWYRPSLRSRDSSCISRVEWSGGRNRGTTSKIRRPCRRSGRAPPSRDRGWISIPVTCRRMMRVWTWWKQDRRIAEKEDYSLIAPGPIPFRLVSPRVPEPQQRYGTVPIRHMNLHVLHLGDAVRVTAYQSLRRFSLHYVGIRLEGTK